MQDPDEMQMVESCLAGDERAWSTLFDQHYQAVSCFVFQLGPTLTLEDVAEVSQEAFLAAVRGLRSFRGKSRLRSWLCQIALNKARDFLEKRNAAKRGSGNQPVSLESALSDDGPVLQMPSPEVTPDVALTQGESHAKLRSALDALGAPCQEILELRYFGDLSYEELAQTLDLHQKTVSSRLSKCLDKLLTMYESLDRREDSVGDSV